MKYTVYILIAVLCLLMALLVLILTIDIFNGLFYEMFRNGPYLCLMLMVLIGTAVLAVIQLIKPMPRLMLIFAGALTGLSISLMLSDVLFIIGVLVGLLPAVDIFVRQGRAVRVQQVRPMKSGLLIVAAVLMGMVVPYFIVNTVIKVHALASIGYPVFYAFNDSTAVIIFGVCLVVLCVAKSRRTSVYYRMFFVGLPAARLLIVPFGYAFQLWTNIPVKKLILDMAASAVMLLAVVFALIHAIRHRREDFTPPAPEPSEPDAATAA